MGEVCEADVSDAFPPPIGAFFGEFLLIVSVWEHNPPTPSTARYNMSFQCQN